MAGGKYPIVTGLEHDEMGHPSGSPKMHTAMTNKRRDKLVKLSDTLPLPPVHGDEEGDVLIVGWGSTTGPIKESVDRLRSEGHKAACIAMRHMHPMPAKLDTIFNRYKHVIVTEINDYGVYGFGQLAMLLRAAYALPHIQSVCKTDGLAFRIREIVTGVEKVMAGK